MRIGVDAMGGDYAPREIVRGVVEAAGSFHGDELVLVGEEQSVLRELEHSGYSGNGKIRVVHASEVIGMDESPVEAIRAKKDSSINRLAQMAGRGELDAIISAGNTGAFAAASQLRMKLLPGVARPGIAVVFPSFAGPVVLCDAGANIVPKPHHLVQYALMASAYAKHVLRIDRPRVALLSIGEEESKGTSLVREAHELLWKSPAVNFVGNCEGRDLFRGSCDVVVCDGFSGNITLKLCEGLSEGLFKIIAKEVQLASPDLAVKLEPVFRRIWANHDYSEYGGAPLLGVAGVSIICHGASDHVAIRNAVRVAGEYLDFDLNSIMTAELASLPAVDPLRA